MFPFLFLLKATSKVQQSLGGFPGLDVSPAKLFSEIAEYFWFYWN